MSTLRDIKTFVSEGNAYVTVEFDGNRRYSYAVTQPISAQNVAFALHHLADMIMDDTESELRGSGRTTRQLRDAPIGAVYVVRDSTATARTRRIAMSLGRPDISIVTPAALDDDNWVRSLQQPAIIVDHATRLVGRQNAAVDYIQSRMTRN